MRNVRNHIIWGWMIIWGISAGAAAGIAAGPVPERAAPAVRSVAFDVDDEMDRFFKAKEHVFKREWNDARKKFNSYLEKYPKGRLRDEALFWLAQSLNMLSKSASGEESINRLKQDAVVRLNGLIEDFPESLWRDDALALRVEISGHLVLAGREEYKSHIDEAVESRKQNERELKLLALNSLAELDAKYALPILERLLGEDPDREVRSRVMALLARRFPQSARALLEETVATDKDDDIRKEALDWLERLRMQAIPVHLQYHIYGSRLLDESAAGRFPEGEVRDVRLASTGSENIGGLLDEVQTVIGAKISRFMSSANGQMPYFGHYTGDRRTTITHRAGDYQLWIKPDELRVSPDEIRGEIQFRHRETNRKFDQPFRLAKAEARLLVTRSGDRMSILILRFREEAPPAAAVDSIEVESHPSMFSKAWRTLSRIFGSESRPVHHNMFNLMDWEIHSTRNSWPLDDLIGKSGRWDFGNAEALSKSPEGWKLVGHLLLLKKERRFIARKAVLIDPEGRRAAVGDEIVVPVDRPSDYKVTGRRRIEPDEPELPDHGPFKAQGHFTLEHDVVVHTVREYFNAGEFARPLFNFEQAKVEIPSEVVSRSRPVLSRMTGGRESSWTLLGDIFWLKDQKRMVGFGAVLLDPERVIKARGLISVPIEDPAAFRILRGKAFRGKRLLLAHDERRTRHFYPTLHKSVQGWEILTTQHSSGTADPTKHDYSLAQAIRIHEGRDWILIGHLMLLRKERRFIAREAALINSDGEIVFGAELSVSTDDPADHKIVKR